MMYYQVTTNSAVTNRSLTQKTNNWKKFSRCLWTKKSHIPMPQINKLLICFQIKVTNNCLIFVGERSLSSISFSCFLDFVPRLNSIYSEWILPISICFIKKICEVTCVKLDVS